MDVFGICVPVLFHTLEAKAIIVSGQSCTQSPWPTSRSPMSLMPCWMVQVPCTPIPQHTLFAHMFGYIAGFPNTYAGKVGKTSDALYKGCPCTCKEPVVCFASWPFFSACFSAYMSSMISSGTFPLSRTCSRHAALDAVHCSSIFPRCTMPQSRSEPMPAGGRVPMCLHLVRLILCKICALLCASCSSQVHPSFGALPRQAQLHFAVSWLALSFA